MDALSAVLDGPRRRPAFLLRSLLRPPWALRIEDGAALTVVAVAAGGATLTPDDGEGVRLDAGDVALVRGPHGYTVTDPTGTVPTVRIGPQQVCTTLAGAPLTEFASLGVRTWGNIPAGSHAIPYGMAGASAGADLHRAAPAGPTVMLTGTYERVTAVGGLVLDTLPPVVALAAAEWQSPLVTLLAQELAVDGPGQRAVLDRLLDLVLVAALRTWAAGRATAPWWQGAAEDPPVAQAVELLHARPEQSWTVAALAREVGMSRASLARRFHERVGVPPMAYLSTWRLTLAADLLLEPGATVGGVGRRVGYANPFTFSAAFKRRHGSSPMEHRHAGSAAAERMSSTPLAPHAT